MFSTCTSGHCSNLSAVKVMQYTYVHVYSCMQKARSLLCICACTNVAMWSLLYFDLIVSFSYRVQIIESLDKRLYCTRGGRSHLLNIPDPLLMIPGIMPSYLLSLGLFSRLRWAGVCVLQRVG